MSELIDVPVRGDLGRALAEFRALAPDAVIGQTQHDFECRTPDTGNESDCSCEVVYVLVEGYVSPDVAS